MKKLKQEQVRVSHAPSGAAVRSLTTDLLALLQIAKSGSKPGKIKTHKDLSDLVNCFKSAHFKGFDVAAEKGKSNEIFSFVEGKSIKFATKHQEEYSARASRRRRQRPHGRLLSHSKIQ